MASLTLGISNRDRWQPGTDVSNWFEKSIENQSCKDFEVLIADGGSQNYEELVQYCNDRDGTIKFNIIQHKIGKAFERARLNNVAIRNAQTPYVLTTDIDMFFADYFVKTILENCAKNTFLEARTLYWKKPMVDLIYSGQINPLTHLDDARRGRIKKRTSAGGCQCAHISAWEEVRGFDERMVGWGSEDYDLLLRMKKAGFHVKWLCESRDEVMVFHQHHAKDDLKFDLACQEQNKKVLHDNSPDRKINPSGWGGLGGFPV